jgi:hypothetical protein
MPNKCEGFKIKFGFPNPEALFANIKLHYFRNQLIRKKILVELPTKGTSYMQLSRIIQTKNKL